ncbi:hypothetical protein PISMIDRAFT_14743 [Pisolithus microcarpus 441]|uniref:Uncharacterized protein n=1 Tax=Pisolithus microcarpus 441 TaxID=765257 RepID=A0A0C9YVB7_9AGAM|nr:hypothetical protein PISMIDRAFT_14743 [Pisolithus microcarpus 441]
MHDLVQTKSPELMEAYNQAPRSEEHGMTWVVSTDPYQQLEERAESYKEAMNNSTMCHSSPVYTPGWRALVGLLETMTGAYRDYAYDMYHKLKTVT